MQLKDAQMILTGPHAFANFDYSVNPQELGFQFQAWHIGYKSLGEEVLAAFLHAFHYFAGAALIGTVLQIEIL